MAFEDGDNIFSYCGEIFKKYKADNLVFMKAIQIVQYFQTRPDYPYCIEELDKSISNLLGQSLTQMAFGAGKYATMSGEYIKWDPSGEEEWVAQDGLVDDVPEEDIDSLVNSFKSEFLAFCYALSPVFDKIFLMNDTPMKLSRLTLSKISDSDESILRIIRNDGESLDLLVDQNDINFIIRTLGEKIDGTKHN